MGYAPKGEQLKLPKSTPRITTSSALVVASATSIVKRLQQNKPFNTISFLEFLKSVEFPTGCVVLLDNVSFHHAKIVKAYAEEKMIHLLYTPPYSPWFNPIEGVFSIVKRQFYKDGNIDNAFNSVTSNHLNAAINIQRCAILPVCPLILQRNKANEKIVQIIGKVISC
jgi:hypothetical protein